MLFVVYHARLHLTVKFDHGHFIDTKVTAPGSPRMVLTRAVVSLFFLKVVCMKASLSNLNMIRVFTSKTN